MRQIMLVMAVLGLAAPSFAQSKPKEKPKKETPEQKNRRKILEEEDRRCGPGFYWDPSNNLCTPRDLR